MVQNNAIAIENKILSSTHTMRIDSADIKQKKVTKTFLFFIFNTVITVVISKRCQLTDFRVLCIINLQLINPKTTVAKADETNIAIQESIVSNYDSAE